MKIIRIASDKLRNEEWFQFATEFVHTVEKYGVNVLQLYGFLPTFIALLEQADELLEVIRKSTFTKEIEDADKERDRIFIGFYAYIKALRNQLSLTRNEAAEKLYVLFRQYNKPIRYGSKAQESGAIYNLLEELEGRHQADVALLGLSEWTIALREAETHFLSLYNERVEENLDKPNADLREVRRSATASYTAMLSIIDAGLLIGGFGDTPAPDEEDDENASGGDNGSGSEGRTDTASATVYNFAIEWNERLRYYRNILAHRHGQKKAAEETKTKNAPH
jgi:hypothetical protein